MNIKCQKLRVLLSALIVCLAAAGVISIGTAAADPVVVTENGPLKGITTATTHEYLGIPYAVPPIGTLRWTPPQPSGRWHGVLDATKFGNFCTQPNGTGGTFGSEDCLSLNVYTPRQKKNHEHDGPWQEHHRRPLPVMVWIHGGSLVSGGGGFYDPTRIVEQGDVIVVTINYRLGLLGFFAHPAIDAEGHRNGNYGTMDQQLALKWVKSNIAAFGGDSDRVTIFGESAGAQSVYVNLTSPTAAGLFERAIAESGAYVQFQDYFDSIVPLAQGETAGSAYVLSGIDQATAMGCTSQTAQCLRALPASTVILQDPSVTYPFVDGTILTTTPTAAFASGAFNRVPVITGGNHDEYRLFVADAYDALGHPLASTDYTNATLKLFGNSLGRAVLLLYPLTNYPNPGEALGASGTDAIFACPERNSVRSLSQYVRTYAYEFNDENAYLVFNQFPSPPYPAISFPLGAPHFSEVPYLFDVFSTTSVFTPDQKDLSEAMISYWTRFAAKGNPNSPDRPHWTPYNSATDIFHSLVPPTPTDESTFDTDHLCSAFWNTF